MSDTASDRRPVLDPTERFSEVLFGLIMVLTFTGTLSAVNAERTEVRTMLVGALGCNVAWGFVDAVMYVIATVADRSRGGVLLRRLRSIADRRAAHGIIASVMPERIASVLKETDLESMRERLVALPDRARPFALTRDDLLGALYVFLLVFLSTFPPTVPFMLFSDAHLALRLSNAIALVMLFGLGYSLGKHAGGRPWVMGLAMLVVGGVLVAVTIALGG